MMTRWDSGANAENEMSKDSLKGIRERMWQILNLRGQDLPTEPACFEQQAKSNGLLKRQEFAQPGREASSWPWILQEWRRTSIPQWQRILLEAEAKDDSKRAAYAKWMLDEVLGAEND